MNIDEINLGNVEKLKEFFPEEFDLSKYTERDFKTIQNKILEITSNEKKEFSFTYNGNPKAAPRPRIRGNVNKATGKSFAKMYDPGSKDKLAIRKYVKELIAEDKNFEMISGPIWLRCKYYKPIPKSYSRADKFLCEAGIINPEKKPDVDNYDKTLMDAINGILFIDDAQIVEVHSSKHYSVEPRIEVTLEYYQERVDKK